MEGLPASVARRLQDLAFNERAVAYLQIDAGLALAGAGGHLETFGLTALRLGEAAAEQAVFLHGLLPQVGEIERMARLKRFFAPALAELIVSSGNERILESHRRDIAVLFCDLRGFTSFAENAEPEEVMELLHHYHGALVPLIQAFEGTL